MRKKRIRVEEAQMRIMLIGSLPPPLGGTTVTLKQLVERLDTESDIDICVVDSSGIRGHLITGLFKFIGALIKIFIAAFRVEKFSSLFVLCTGQVSLYMSEIVGAVRAWE